MLRHKQTLCGPSHILFNITLKCYNNYYNLNGFNIKYFGESNVSVCRCMFVVVYIIIDHFKLIKTTS